MLLVGIGMLGYKLVVIQLTQSRSLCELSYKYIYHNVSYIHVGAHHIHTDMYVFHAHVLTSILL